MTGGAPPSASLPPHPASGEGVLSSSSGKPWVGILGGSFNPPHYGHLRLAVEVMEALRPVRIDFLPAPVPPHKGRRGLLPFELRAAMLEESLRGLEGYRVNTMENEREGPSYTSDTLRIYRQREPGVRHCFILGAEDFASIISWHEWRLLPELADIAVVSRAGSEVEVFMNTIRHGWPEAIVQAPCHPLNCQYTLPAAQGGGMLMHLPLPRLDIRAELVRERFLAGRSIRFLVPERVESLLLHTPETTACWTR